MLLATLFVIALKIFILKSVRCSGENLTTPLSLKKAVYDAEAITKHKFVIMQCAVLFLCIIFSAVDNDHGHFVKYANFQALLPRLTDSLQKSLTKVAQTGPQLYPDCVATDHLESDF